MCVCVCVCVCVSGRAVPWSGGPSLLPSALRSVGLFICRRRTKLCCRWTRLPRGSVKSWWWTPPAREQGGRDGRDERRGTQWGESSKEGNRLFYFIWKIGGLETSASSSVLKRRCFLLLERREHEDASSETCNVTFCRSSVLFNWTLEVKGQTFVLNAEFRFSFSVIRLFTVTVSRFQYVWCQNVWF